MRDYVPAPTPGTAARTVRDIILTGRWSFTTERDLQDALHEHLARTADNPWSPLITVAREHPLDDRNRIDFLVTVNLHDHLRTVGVEIKIGASLPTVTRQLTRYAAFDQVDELLLVTTKAHHHHIPVTIHGKPVALCSLIENAL